METLRQLVAAHGNDYTALEARYRDATGGELVAEPYDSFVRAHPVSKTATILIGAYNSAGSLLKTLVSLDVCTFNQKYGDRLQVVVVDDGSTDQTRAVVCETPLNLNLVYVRQANGGLARAHNTGLAFATGDIIIFSDADMVHTPHAIEELMKRHQVLGDVLLIGFRCEMAADSEAVASNELRTNIANLEPVFHRDFRLNFPGRPNNVCRDTRHLKDFGSGRTLSLANGATYDLAAMAVGAFMSFSRPDYIRIGGSCEQFAGWGCEDTLIGTQLMALGRFVVPVYAAASAHITHDQRASHQNQQFAANLKTMASILAGPLRLGDAPLQRFRARALEVAERTRSSADGVNTDTAIARTQRRDTADAHAAAGDAHYAMGQFGRAVDCYTRAAELAPDITWHHLGRAKSLREAFRIDESVAAFARSLELAPWNCWATYELGLTHARLGDYGRARACVEKARTLAPDAFEFRWALDTSSDQHKRRGNGHARQGFHSIAVVDFDLALIAKEDNAWAHHDRGTSLCALDRREEAVAAHARADRWLHPDDGNRTWVHSALGRLCLELGRLGDAQQQLERALELWRDNPDANADQGKLVGLSWTRLHAGPESGGIRSVVCENIETPPHGGWPLLVFLHGRGEAADRYPTPDESARVQGPLWRRHHGGWQPPFLVLCPQLATRDDRWHEKKSLDAVTEIVQRLLADHADAINPQRIVLTGFSIGGLGCYALAWHWQNTAAFRAWGLLPVDAADPLPQWQRSVAAGAIEAAVWSHHGEGNKNASDLELLVSGLPRRAASLYQGAHGEIGRNTYRRGDVYRWLLNEK